MNINKSISVEMDEKRKELKRAIAQISREFRRYQESSNVVLQKQQCEIKKLLEEKDSLLRDIAAADSPARRKDDKKMTDELERLAKETEESEKLVNAQKEALKELDRKIAIVESKKKAQLINNSQQNKHTVTTFARQMRHLENEYERISQAYNKQLKRNCELRDQIDHLRHGYNIYSKYHRLAMNKLANMRNQKMSLMREAIESFDNENETRKKINLAKQHNLTDKEQYAKNMVNLERIFSGQEDLIAFLTVKTRDHSKELTEISFNRAREKSKKVEAADRELIAKYEEALENIKTLINTKRVDDIVEEFKSREEENYSLFNYICEVNQSIDSAQLELETKIREKDSLQSQHVFKDGCKLKIVQELEEKEKDLQQQLSFSSKQYEALRSRLDEVKHPVQKLYDLIGCCDLQMESSLGFSKHVTDANLMTYMGVIEERAVNLVNTHFFAQEMLKKQSQSNTEAAPLALAQVVTAPVVTCTAPSLSDMETVDATLGESTFPLSHEKLVSIVRQQTIPDSRKRAKSRIDKDSKKNNTELTETFDTFNADDIKKVISNSGILMSVTDDSTLRGISEQPVSVSSGTKELVTSIPEHVSQEQDQPSDAVENIKYLHDTLQVDNKSIRDIPVEIPEHSTDT